jgi:hypothetical protein
MQIRVIIQTSYGSGIVWFDSIKAMQNWQKLHYNIKVLKAVTEE